MEASGQWLVICLLSHCLQEQGRLGLGTPAHPSLLTCPFVACFLVLGALTD